MIRDLKKLQSEKYDLIIVGGGIYGAAICWEAVSRGLKVALLEKSDFGSETSANSLKIIHGGFRYLQYFDLSRLRESSGELRNLMRIAPHLVHPMPVLVPIYEHGWRGIEAFSLGIKLFNILPSSADQLDDPQKILPPARIMSKEACIERLPSIRLKGLNGGALFFDGQVYNSERLVLSFIFSAWEKGADPANYAQVIGFVEDDQKIRGVKVKDVFDGDEFEVISKVVLLACGPWTEDVLGLIRRKEDVHNSGYIKAVNLVTRKLFPQNTIAFLGKNKFQNGQPLPHQKENYLFVSSWRDYSLIGTFYHHADRDPNEIKVRTNEVESFLNEFNKVYPSGKLSLSDVFFSHTGLLPDFDYKRGDHSVIPSNRSRIVDYHKDGYEGLLSVEGVKYTTARTVAEKTIDLVFRRLGYPQNPSRTALTPLYGGEIRDYDNYVNGAIKKYSEVLGENQIERLIQNFGSKYPEIMDRFQVTSSTSGDRAQQMLEAQIHYAIEHEMAMTLGDIILRRTDIGSAGYPGDDWVRFSAQVMARDLGWSQARIGTEIERVKDVYRRKQELISEHGTI